MEYLKTRYLVPIILLLLAFVELRATHIRAAEITYKRISEELFTYEFTLTGFTDTGSPVRFGDGTFNFGDGREVQIDLEASSFEEGIFLEPNNEIEVYRITIIHTYVSPGFYVVSYREPNRNDEIVNINKGNSVQTPFYLEASLLIDPLIGPNDSPVFNSFPVDRGFVGQTFTHNPWAWDAEGDSLVFRILTPLQDHGQPVPNFELPGDPDFYIPPIDFSTGNENGTGPAVFQLNPYTGDMVWDAPGNVLQNSQGPFSEYSVAFLVEEWREVEGSWKRIGHVTRDMQIIITPQENTRPDFEIPGETLLLDSEAIQETIIFNDPGGDQIKVEYFGEVFDLENNPISVSPGAGDFVEGPLSLTFEWLPLPEHERTRPYYVHLKITDHPSDPEINPSVTYKTWVLSFSDFPEIITDLNDMPQKPRLMLYPNPTVDLLKWQHPIDRLFKQLVIYNSNGQQTISMDLTSSTIRELEISNLSSGLYFAQFISQKDSYRGVFIKQ